CSLAIRSNAASDSVGAAHQPLVWFSTLKARSIASSTKSGFRRRRYCVICGLSFVHFSIRGCNGPEDANPRAAQAVNRAPAAIDGLRRSRISILGSVAASDRKMDEAQATDYAIPSPAES